MFHGRLFCSKGADIVRLMSNRPGPLAQRIAAEIRAELGRQQLSRRQLADKIDQNHVTVSRWVKGDGPMSFEALDAICEALGINVADVLAAADRQRSDTSRGSGRNTREDRLLGLAA